MTLIKKLSGIELFFEASLDTDNNDMDEWLKEEEGKWVRSGVAIDSKTFLPTCKMIFKDEDTFLRFKITWCGIEGGLEKYNEFSVYGIHARYDDDMIDWLRANSSVIHFAKAYKQSKKQFLTFRDGYTPRRYEEDEPESFEIYFKDESEIYKFISHFPGKVKQQ